MNISMALLMIGIVLGLGLVFAMASFYMVRPFEKGIIERLGKFHAIKDQGFHFKIPMVDRLIKIQVAEEMIDIPSQIVITKDNVSIKIDGVVYMKVENPQNALYKIEDYKNALSMLAKTTLRSVIGGMDLDETLNSRQKINDTIAVQLDKICMTWGVDVIRVEIQEITPPKDILFSMEKQVTAEREKRATVINSEAKLVESKNIASAQIETAKGIKESTILQAQAKKLQYELEGEGQAKAIKLVSNEIKQQGSAYIQLKQIERWNGTVPQTVLSKEIPMLLNINPEQQKPEKTKKGD